MTRSSGLSALALALAAVALAYGSAFLPGGAPAWAPWLLLVGTVLSLLAISVLGAVREGKDAGRLAWVFALTFLLVAGGLALAIAVPEPAPGDPLVLGLPLGAAILVYGVGLLPLIVVPLAYAWTFPELGFREGELEEIRSQALAAVERDQRARAPAETERPEGDPPR